MIRILYGHFLLLLLRKHRDLRPPFILLNLLPHLHRPQSDENPPVFCPVDTRMTMCDP